MSEFAASCLIWLLGIWLGVNAAAVTALAVAAKISGRGTPPPEPEPELESKRTWATEMGLRQPK
jgi:hypothetical protein